MTVAKSERQPIISTEKVIEYGVAGYMCSLASTFFILRAWLARKKLFFGIRGMYDGTG